VKEGWILSQESDQEQEEDDHQQDMDKISAAAPPASPAGKGAKQPQDQQNDDNGLKGHGISPSFRDDCIAVDRKIMDPFRVLDLLNVLGLPLLRKSAKSRFFFSRRPGVK